MNRESKEKLYKPSDFTFFPNISCKEGKEHLMRWLQKDEISPYLYKSYDGVPCVEYCTNIWECVNCRFRANILLLNGKNRTKNKKL